MRVQYTETWVGRLYEGLRPSAPWRFAAALETYQAERRRLGRPAGKPVVLFQLGGLNQARRPCVALDAHGGAPTLRLIWTGSNAVLPRSLWQRPPDLGRPAQP